MFKTEWEEAVNWAFSEITAEFPGSKPHIYYSPCYESRWGKVTINFSDDIGDWEIDLEWQRIDGDFRFTLSDTVGSVASTLLSELKQML